MNKNSYLIFTENFWENLSKYKSFIFFQCITLFSYFFSTIYSKNLIKIYLQYFNYNLFIIVTK